jgi:hypothetical protein
MRLAGCDHGIENRRSMCGLICEPSPSRNRPSLISWRSLARTATFIGLRAKATAIADCSEMCVVARATSVRVVNTSCLASAALKPS